MTEKQELELTIKTLDEHKAEDIQSVDVTGTSPFYDYVVLATCPNPRALFALSEYLEDAYASNDVDVSVKEGEPDSGWVIIQGGSVIAHLLLQGNRRALNLEEFLEKLKEIGRE